MTQREERALAAMLLLLLGLIVFMLGSRWGYHVRGNEDEQRHSVTCQSVPARD